jgi:hypothetical protein
MAAKVVPRATTVTSLPALANITARYPPMAPPPPITQIFIETPQEQKIFN